MMMLAIQRPLDGGNLPWLKVDIIMIFEPQDIIGGVRFKYDDDVLIQQNQVYKIWRS